jgi:hypothetical protein
MDALFPMMYFRDNQFFPFAIDWQEQAAGRIVAPGLAIYFLDPKEGRWTLDVVTRQLSVVRQMGMGHCFFRSKFLTDDTKGIYGSIRQFNAVPALIPPMTWLSSTPPLAPQDLKLENGMLTWQSPVTDTHSALPYYIYNIYASPDFPVDVTNPENLLATRLQGTRLRIPQDKRLNYAVTAQDRYGLESHPAQLLLNAGPKYVIPKLALVKGSTITLPAKPATLDADYVVVEDMKGRQVAVYLYRDTMLNISGLPNGFYQLRSLGRKGRNHRMGFFTVKREKGK